jgi:hypothetical protein
MPGFEENKKLVADIARIDSQMAALAKLKRQRIAQLTIAESAEALMSREERLEAISDVLAEAIVYLGERGLLVYKDDEPMQTPEKSPGECVPKKKKGRGSAK